VQPVYPLQGYWERRNALLPHMLTIERFFRFADSLDQLRGDPFVQPLAKNRVVALPERAPELFVRDRGTFAGHCVTPRLPMVLRRVDEPEHRLLHPVKVLWRISLSICDVSIDLLKFKAAREPLANRFGYSTQGELLEATGIAIELTNSFG